MKKLLLLVGILLTTSAHLFATHIVSGYISYKHISGLTYEISVVTYSDISSTAADRCEIEVDFGDGNRQMVQRINGLVCGNCIHCGELVSGFINVKRNIYTVTYTYSSAGTYKISMHDNNRTSGIVNIPNSTQVPFFLETVLVIPSSTSINNSSRALSPMIANAQQGTDFHFNIPVMDEDSDILTYELVSPKGAGGNDIPGYTAFTATVDPLSGAFSWNNFPAIGMYVFAIKVSECNANNSLGYTIFELAVYVQPSAANTSFTGLSNWPTDSQGRYSTTIGPNDSVDLDITFTDANTSSNIGLASISETFVNGNVATFTTVSSSATSITKKFKWKPNSNNLRCAPYIVTFRGNTTVGQTTTSNDITLMIFVKDQTTNCTTVCGGIVSSVEESKYNQFEIKISPNPIQNEAVISFSSKENLQNTQFNVYDLLGKRVQSIPVNSQTQFTFYRENLPSGIYVYELLNNTRVLSTGKLVIVD